MMANIKINNMSFKVPEGLTILEAAQDNNIKIPTLCHYPDLDIKSDCRVCGVEIANQKGLAPACSTPVRDGMEIKINSPRAQNARKAIIEMILANHDANCTACVRNMNCELQNLSKSLGIEENRFDSVLDVVPIEESNPSIVRNPNRCIKCGRCVDVCKNVQGISVLETMGRSFESKVTPAYGKELKDVFCTYCGQCASVCPVGAIMEKDNTEEVWSAIDDDRKHVIVQVAPAVRVSLGEELNFPLGSIVTGKVVSALKMLGFSKVFDTNFTADLTIIEEGHELIHRLKNGGKLPIITSCCPGWVKFAETKFPELLEYVSTCKSPQQMFGALAKTYYAQREGIDPKDIHVVSIMPCTAKKFESERPEMSVNQEDPDVDTVLTTRELAKMVKQMGIDFNNLRERPFDKPDEMTSGAAAIFGASGGVMEAGLRSVKEILEGKHLEKLDFTEVRGMEGIREAELTINGDTHRIAVAHSLANARKISQKVKEGTNPYSFIEIMACPGGCIGGGGQPYGTTTRERHERIQSIYQIDRLKSVRKSHDNPAVMNLYSTYLGEPLGERSHTLLHTHYVNRKEK